jgi:excisionase family DNA binding protein
MSEAIKLLLKPREAAAALSISERTLFTLTKDKAIPHIRLGPQLIRYDLDQLREWIRQNSEGALDGKHLEGTERQEDDPVCGQGREEEDDPPGQGDPEGG